MRASLRHKIYNRSENNGAEAFPDWDKECMEAYYKHAAQNMAELQNDFKLVHSRGYSLIVINGVVITLFAYLGQYDFSRIFLFIISLCITGIAIYLPRKTSSMNPYFYKEKEIDPKSPEYKTWLEESLLYSLLKRSENLQNAIERTAKLVGVGALLFVIGLVLSVLMLGEYI